MFRRIACVLIALGLTVGCENKRDDRASPTPTTAASPPAASAQRVESASDFQVVAETFEDVQILRYRVPGFEALPRQQKELAYYLYEAALSGRDIIYDQKHRDNLAIRRTLEAIFASYTGDKTSPAFDKLETYAKLFWLSDGIHHHNSTRKLEPKLSFEEFSELVKKSDQKRLPLEQPPVEGGEPTVDGLLARLKPVIFDPKVDAIQVNRASDADLIADSANNFYQGVTQKEVEAFYKQRMDPKDPRPISHGLNSKLVRQDGKLVERVWKLGGMYGPAIEKIVFWLNKAVGVAENPKQKRALELLIRYYQTGDLKTFDEYSVAWVQDVDSRIDVINGFIETYGDALGYRASWESVVSMRDVERSKRIATIGNAAQWFEQHSPIADAHKREKVVGISAKVITVIVEAGDAAPTTPVGINLPNANWIRKEHGSKSVFLGNIMDAYEVARKQGGVLEEFAASEEEKARAKKYGEIASALKVDMHEVIGHASGRIEDGVGTPKETLKNYASALEEARADLVALYYVMDPKLIELGVMESLEVGKAAYDAYILNGLLVQLARVPLGENIEQSHMRNRHMISSWAFEQAKADKAIERIERDGKTYFVIRDYDKLRALFGKLLREVQRINSRGDFAAGKKLIETYGVKLEPELHREIRDRYAKLKAKPFSGFIQPRLVPIRSGDEITDVKVEYPDDFTEQMLFYGKEYSFLPTYN
jgi:dipeptidyl-peptidase III